MIILGYLLLYNKYLGKITHEGWLEVPTILSSSSNVKLGMVYMKDHGNSWMKIMLNSFLFSL